MGRIEESKGLEAWLGVDLSGDSLERVTGFVCIPRQVDQGWGCFKGYGGNRSLNLQPLGQWRAIADHRTRDVSTCLLDKRLV